jgi:hypothetical protein
MHYQMNRNYEKSFLINEVYKACAKCQEDEGPVMLDIGERSKGNISSFQ